MHMSHIASGFRSTNHDSSWRQKEPEERSLEIYDVHDGRAQRCRETFKQIMMDASVLHWKNLANFSILNQSVYVYDHGSRSAEKPGREIEWPIVWLLSAFPRKHIFVPQGILETNHMNTDATRFTRRVGRGMGSSQG